MQQRENIKNFIIKNNVSVNSDNNNIEEIQKAHNDELLKAKCENQTNIEILERKY